MDKNFTQEDIIRFLYHETTSAESEKIKEAILFDTKLSEKYFQLKAEIDFLNSFEISAPLETSIEIILQRSHELHQTEYSLV